MPPTDPSSGDPVPIGAPLTDGVSTDRPAPEPSGFDRPSVSRPSADGLTELIPAVSDGSDFATGEPASGMSGSPPGPPSRGPTPVGGPLPPAGPSKVNDPPPASGQPIGGGPIGYPPLDTHSVNRPPVGRPPVGDLPDIGADDTQVWPAPVRAGGKMPSHTGEERADDDAEGPSSGRTPSRLLATDPRIAEPAWMALARPGDPIVEERKLTSLRESTRPILDLKALRAQEAAHAAEAGRIPSVASGAGAPVSPRLPDSTPASDPAGADSPLPAATRVPQQGRGPDRVRPPAGGTDADPPEYGTGVAGGGAERDVAPWDHRPLLVALAAAAALVLLGVMSGVVTASLFRRSSPAVVWQGAGDSGSPLTPPAGPPVASDTITLSGVGDVIMGTQPGDLPPRDGSGFFDPVEDAMAADVVMGNLETPLSPDTGRVKCATVTPSPRPGDPSPKPTREEGCHQFYLPPSYANHLRDGGFQLMNLANNHTNDMGAEGLRSTRAALNAAGIKHTGAPGQITYIEVNDVKVAVIGFAVYSWAQSLNDIPAAASLVRKAAAAADLVVIQMQGGAEGADKMHVTPGTEVFYGENRGDLMKFSHAVIDAGADVVFGHGPHIMRGMEFYKGRLIAYSLGNFCGYGVLSSAGYLGVGGILKVTLTKDGAWVGGQLIATEMVGGGMVAVDAQKRALAFVNGLSRDDFGSSAAKISNKDGKITEPATS